MKYFKTIVVVILICYSNQMNAQFAVYDAANHTSAVQSQITRVSNYVKNSKILIEAIKTLKAIKETKELYEQIDDELKFVKDMIQTGQEISEIIQLVDQVSDNYQDNINLIVNDPFVDVIVKDFIIEVYTSELEQAIAAFNSSDLLVSNNVFKMSDGERLELLRKVKYQIRDHLGFIQYFNSKIQYSVKKSKADYIQVVSFSSAQGLQFLQN